MRLAFILLLGVLFIFPSSLSAQKREVVVVIDPGHGGHDPGHLSNNSRHLAEKDLNLKIARYLGEYIEKYLQNVRVIYTRTTDVYPSLDDRVNKANAIGADYFISIHCNGNEHKNIHGTESHVHSLELSKSLALAREIERQFSARAGRKSRGVKDERDLQHSLQVLKFTTMTSVLIECGFITNDKEGEFLNSTYGQEIIASAIFRGFRETIVREYPSISFIRTQPLNNNDTATPVSAAKVYGIQIASSKQPIATDDYTFKRLQMSVERKEINTSSAYKYIYIVGEYGSRSEAKAALATVQSKGFKDAIIVSR